eukprot:1723639-Rhodomonas_salina.3
MTAAYGTTPNILQSLHDVVPALLTSLYGPTPDLLTPMYGTTPGMGQGGCESRERGRGERCEAASACTACSYISHSIPGTNCTEVSVAFNIAVERARPCPS